MTVLSVRPGPAATDSEVDQRDPLIRMEQVLDDGTLELLRERDDTGVCLARGRIDGRPVIVYGRYSGGGRDGQGGAC